MMRYNKAFLALLLLVSLLFLAGCRRAAEEPPATVAPSPQVEEVVSEEISAAKGTVTVAELPAVTNVGLGEVSIWIARLESPVELVRRVAAMALGAIGDPRAIESLIARLEDECWDVREAAAEALGALDAIELLIARLEEGEIDDRKRGSIYHALISIIEDIIGDTTP